MSDISFCLQRDGIKLFQCPRMEATIGLYLQKLCLTEPVLHLQAKQSGTITCCSHLQNIWDRHLGWTNGLYVFFHSKHYLHIQHRIIIVIYLCDYWMQLNIFTEEIIRAGSAASLSSLLNRLDPVLRKTANLGRLLDFYASML